jgi:hypothetical protein
MPNDCPNWYPIVPALMRLLVPSPFLLRPQLLTRV